MIVRWLGVALKVIPDLVWIWIILKIPSCSCSFSALRVNNCLLLKERIKSFGCICSIFLGTIFPSSWTKISVPFSKHPLGFVSVVVVVIC